MQLMKAGNLYLPKVNQIPLIISNAKKLGLNALNVPVIIDFSDYDISQPVLNLDSKTTAMSIIHALHKEGLKTILEPYPLVRGGEGSETGIVPKDVELFFVTWRSILREIVHDIAQPLQVYALNTSSNLVHLESYSDEWIGLFREIKKIYSGLVTYRTNWWVTAVWDTGSGSTTEAYQQKMNNPLFSSSDLDFISISAYFELTERALPSVTQLMEDLDASTIYSRGQNIFAEIKAFYDKWNKPIFFGELGAPSREYAAFQPWNAEPSSVESEIAQANLIEAYRRKFSPFKVR
ncbi:glycoside hydrolase family 113 [Caldalkalibacillus mannanilyticus]|uniref:glycoside hydrolase family 113 n=1 Tax=Caldalkalibacillus mannanilyticus TaxID=1418 RepID=UPI000687C451|nr:hypothetical protein [Caldalkalibacillus mannanilyticus]